MDLISLGIGAPASIETFLTFGLYLGDDVPVEIEPDVVTVDGVFGRNVMTAAMFTRSVAVTVER